VKQLNCEGVFLGNSQIAIPATFQPSYLLLNPAVKRDACGDLKEVLTHLGRPLPNRGKK